MRFDTLGEWLSWQEGLHPTDIDLGLERVAAVWRRLHPEQLGLGCPVITVGGTNGKGSSVALLEAILRAAGYRTGCYTSPHLVRYNERIRLDGLEVSDAELCSAFERVDQARDDVSLTYFEFGTLAALDLFARAGPDLVVLEVGLGGRLDAVNLLDADVALVTAVGVDHTDWLGTELADIAREKAGIFRAGRPAVIGQPDATPALAERAATLGARVFTAGREFRLEVHDSGWSWHGPRSSRSGLPLPALRGARQLENAAAVLMVLDCLNGRLPVRHDALCEGLEQVRLPGRFQLLPGRPGLILDTAHNVQAARTLAGNLQALPGVGAIHAVFGCYADKDAVGMLSELSHLVQHWYLVPLSGRRAMKPEAIRHALHLAGVDTLDGFFASVADALDRLRHDAGANDQILVTGSFATVAAALEHLDRNGYGGLV